MMLKTLNSAYAENHRETRYQYLLLAAITLLAAVLRLYRLGEWSFWIDEIFTINRAQNTLIWFWDLVREGLRSPVSVMLTGGALHFLGVSEWTARIVPAVAGILSIPILYFPIRRMLDPAVALLASLLLAISPWHIYWSQNARFYVFLMLFYALALFAFFFYMERPRLVYFLAFWLLLFLAVRERQNALFLLPVVVGYLVALKILPFEKPEGLSARSILLFFGPPASAYGLYELSFFASTGTTFLRTSVGVLKGFLAAEDPPHLLADILVNLGPPLVALGVLTGIYLSAGRSRAGLLLLLGAVGPIAMLMVLNRLMFTKDRYAFVVLPTYVILGAIAVRQMLRVKAPEFHGKLLSSGLLVVLLVHAAGDDLMYYQVNHGNRLDWRGTFASVEGMRKEGDVVISTWEPLGKYYMGRDVVSWFDLDPRTVQESQRRSWFVVDDEVVGINPKLKDWVERNAELIEVTYLRLPHDLYLRSYLYDPARPPSR